jgi:hypothetical protein
MRFPTLTYKTIRKLSAAMTALMIAPGIVYATKNHVDHEKQLKCLTDNAYYEARGEDVASQKFQVWLTIARSADRKEWGKLPCETVYQKSKSGTYQYSWVPMVHPDPKAYAKVRQVVEEVYTNPKKAVKPQFGCARYYKRTDNKGVSERSKKWFGTLKPVGQFGNHTAYCDRK